MREYERTHPWLTFKLDLAQMPWTLFMLLGEAQSKLDHLAGVPLRPTTAQQLHKIYLAKGVLATTAIEGNTLSEEEVRQHLDGKLELPPSKEYLKREIDNILLACDWIWQRGPAKLTPEFINECNARVLYRLRVEEEVIPGAIRKHSVGVGRYRCPPATDCNYLLEKLCEWLNDPVFDSHPEARGAFAIVRAILAHLYLVWIHPYGDGNGRTARLVEFAILCGSGVPAPAAQLLSNHYNETRTEYYHQLDYASRSGGNIIPFIQYAVRGLVDGLREQLKLVRAQQLDVVWRNYIHETFRDDSSPRGTRQKLLLLDLAIRGKSLAKSDLPAVSTRVALTYANKTPKTLTRDINDLLARKLLLRDTDGKYRANKALISAFLPERHGAAPLLEMQVLDGVELVESN